MSGPIVTRLMQIASEELYHAKARYASRMAVSEETRSATVAEYLFAWDQILLHLLDSEIKFAQILRKTGSSEFAASQTGTSREALERWKALVGELIALYPEHKDSAERSAGVRLETAKSSR